MIEVFSHNNIAFVHHLKNILENNRYPCLFEEVFDSVTMACSGGRILLLEPNQKTDALELIESVFSDLKDETSADKTSSWRCRRCKKEIEPQFSECWYCAGPAE